MKNWVQQEESAMLSKHSGSLMHPWMTANLASIKYVTTEEMKQETVKWTTIHCMKRHTKWDQDQELRAIIQCITTQRKLTWILQVQCAHWIWVQEKNPSQWGPEEDFRCKHLGWKDKKWALNKIEVVGSFPWTIWECKLHLWLCFSGNWNLEWVWIVEKSSWESVWIAV